ncbi:MAG: ABC transporter ATP-binding protein [Planctomycetota bacterium]|jgi:putative ABC transport system ATP-binding protein
MNELVHLDDIHKFYYMGQSVVRALDGVSVRITEGEYVAIMGHSGSGKSTLLNLVGCLDRPTAGRYLLAGEDVSGMTDAQLSEVRGRHIGFVFQSFNLIAQLNVLANIEVPLFYQGLPRRTRRRRSAELADMVGLGDRARHRPTELSGGQQQRVALARALANDPLVLLADEPTGNLDSATTEEILELFDDLNRRGRTVITVTHEDNVAARARRTVQLTDGKVSSDVAKGQEAGA